MRGVAVSMNTNSTVAGYVHENREKLRIIWGGRAIVSLDTTSPCRPYVTTMKQGSLTKISHLFLCKIFKIIMFLFSIDFTTGFS